MRCQHCGGNLMVFGDFDGGGALECLQCGRPAQVITDVLPLSYGKSSPRSVTRPEPITPRRLRTAADYSWRDESVRRWQARQS